MFNADLPLSLPRIFPQSWKTPCGLNLLQVSVLASYTFVGSLLSERLLWWNDDHPASLNPHPAGNMLTPDEDMGMGVY